ncbi:hypothetical protein JTE90_023992 [Oedothorax gibbosus]|uniref:Uncharacterized protein n=1 Tax=Oedothorax gibbosus TaxID=931172 RepID=A0AAV6THU7_9ARAC|nr:hypothetical protein JTE90_023992 [Oedothorax gibbosus]
MYEANAESFISTNKRKVFVLDDEGTYKGTARDLDSKCNKSIYSTEADYNRPSQYASKIRYGHQAKVFIKFCSFNGVECSHKDFTVFADDTFGNCFSFNKVNFSEEPLRSSFVGPNSGINLELDVQSDEYVWLSQSVGARVVIHDPYHEPETQVEGINASPGFETSIGVSKIFEQKARIPLQRSLQEVQHGDNKRKCERLCHLDKVSNTCGGEEDLEEEENITCDCPLKCHSTDFELKTSSGVWPASLESFGDFNVSLEAIRETRVRLKIYFETLEQIVYEQTEVRGFGGPESDWRANGAVAWFISRCRI